jgi:lipopolysaccharide transport system ATP-binding protein
MDDIAIRVNHVCKSYTLQENQLSRVKHAIWQKHTSLENRFHALKDVNFEVRKGESIAIIGRNGSGKSTLLQILTGTLTPTSGSVQVNGRVSALLELGSGFNPEYSGRDNVLLNGLLLGLTKAEIQSRFSEIEEFAEIGSSIERPVKTYSSGMLMRLAFAVQVLCDPDVLIVDEALSVGDFFFQQKCISHIRGLCEKGVTLLFVSHDMQTVRDLCVKGLYLKSGVVQFWGDNMQAINSYLATSTNENAIATKLTSPRVIEEVPNQNLSTSITMPIWVNRGATAKPSILAVGIYSASNHPVTSVRIGENLLVYVQYIDDINDPCHVTCTLKNRYNQVVTTFGTYTQRISIHNEMPEMRTLRIEVGMALESGEYSLQVNLGQATNTSTGKTLFETDWIGPLSVIWHYEVEIPPFYGLVGLPITAGFC